MQAHRHRQIGRRRSASVEAPTKTARPSAFASGDTTINVYRSSFAGTNKATALTWAVDDVEEVVRTLRGKGIEFEHYDLPDTRREGDVHVSGDIRVAWFKDPDGNILSVVNR